ncbi:MAG: hypothetical protein U9R17_00150 [Thermodesulfobacteriota bacterium]|nr:hypothetical protein [Thermodesulfobacteriota bacterium]
MGVDVIVMVENTREISLEDFFESMDKDKWGKRWGYHSFSYNLKLWTEFEWEGKRYFFLTCGPRYSRLVARYDFGLGEYYDNPDFDSEIQVPFLRAMLAAERIAGGPVFLGNDAVWVRDPSENPKENRYFSIPPELGVIIKNWREIAESDAGKIENDNMTRTRKEFNGNTDIKSSDKGISDTGTFSDSGGGALTSK